MTKLNTVQRDFLVKGIGEDEVAKIEAAAEKSANALKQLGVEFKQTEAAAATGAEAQPNETLEAVKALGGAVVSMAQQMEQLIGVVTSTKATAESALQVATKAKDDIVSDEFLARAKAIAGSGGAAPRPSESENNVTDATKVKAQGLPGGETDFSFADLITKQIGMGLKVEGGAALAAVTSHVQ